MPEGAKTLAFGRGLVYNSMQMNNKEKPDIDEESTGNCDSEIAFGKRKRREFDLAEEQTVTHEKNHLPRHVYRA